MALCLLVTQAYSGLRPQASTAQLFQRIDDRPSPWLMRLLPYPTWDPVEGFAGNLRFGFIKRGNAAPPPLSKAVNLEAQITQRGTIGVHVRYEAPGWWRDWRLLAYAGAERLRRVPYYGLGNSSVLDDSADDLFYRYQLSRVTGGLVVQRRIAGPLRLHLGLQWRQYHATPLADSSAFGIDLVAGTVTDTSTSHSAEVRAGLLFDTRDEEASPTRGLLLEFMGVQSATDYRYTRWLAGGRLFIPFGEFEQWVIGLRQTVELTRGAIPVFIQYERPTTWLPEDGFGGATSLRLFAPGRFVAPNRGIASVDLRKKLLDFPLRSSPMRLWALAFADAGRLWDQGERPGLRDLHWSAGLGGRFQMGKATIIGLDIGSTDESKFTFAFATSFAF